MSLRNKQVEFARLVPRLIDKAFELGYEVTLGDAYRDPRVHGEFGEKVAYSRSRSVHKLKLAIDLNLFKDGQFLSTTEAHRPLGEWWESQHPDARWGGHYSDGNHYSFIFQGAQ